MSSLKKSGTSQASGKSNKNKTEEDVEPKTLEEKRQRISESMYRSLLRRADELCYDVDNSVEALQAAITVERKLNSQIVRSTRSEVEAISLLAVSRLLQSALESKPESRTYVAACVLDELGLGLLADKLENVCELSNGGACACVLTVTGRKIVENIIKVLAAFFADSIQRTEAEPPQPAKPASNCSRREKNSGK